MKMIVVEPFTLLYYFAWSSFLTVQMANYRLKACERDYTDSIVDCRSITAYQEELAMLKESAVWTHLLGDVFALPAIFITVIMSSWGDIYGKMPINIEFKANKVYYLLLKREQVKSVDITFMHFSS